MLVVSALWMIPYHRRSGKISSVKGKYYRYLYGRIQERKAVVAVVGVGYVGLPLLVEIAKAGFPTLAIDKNPERMKQFSLGQSYIPDVPENILKALLQAEKTHASSYSELSRSSVIVICVPTPLSKTREPDISHILDATHIIAKHLRQGQLIILESTTFPGTTEEVVLSILLNENQTKYKRKWKVGKDFFLGYSPERVDPGNARYRIANTPKIVSGVSPACLRLTELFYSQFVEKVIPVSSPRVAEMAKLLENTYRAVNIGLANEMAILCHRLGINVWEVIQAASTKSFGFQPFYPGPGLGGHCIPVDPLYLSYKARTLKYNPRFHALADTVNQSMPRYVVSRILNILKNSGIALKNARILVFGVTYKENVADTRESPAIELLKILLQKGASVFYHDPYIPSLSIDNRIFQRIGDSAQLDYPSLNNYHLIVIATAHSSYNWKKIVKYGQKIFDLRNAIPFPSKKVEKL